jgi:queuine tRNA-ribosyltransferase
VFELIKTEGKARRGVFSCAHGTAQTPVFMNVGTQAAIKGGLSAYDLNRINCQIELSNTSTTFPCALRTETVRALGGLHGF